jgi:hypothetical protein
MVNTITIPNHGLNNGAKVILKDFVYDSDTIELNGRFFYVKVIDINTVSLYTNSSLTILQDLTGVSIDGNSQVVPVEFQATAVYNSPGGFTSDGRGILSRNQQTVTLAANTTDYIFDTAKLFSYIPGSTDAILVVNPGIIITSLSTASPAITITGFIAGDTIAIVNNGYIIGRGGDGGRGGGLESGSTLFPAVAGGNGGPAIELTSLTGIPISVENNGVLAGGSGGGGGGGWGYSIESNGYSTFNIVAGGGGGGGGITNGAGGIHGRSLQAYGAYRVPTTGPGAGTPPAYTFGAGRTDTANFGGATVGGVGGNGGALASAGSTGGTGTGSQSRVAGAIGGLAGKAINLNGAIYTAVAAAVTLSSVVIGGAGTFTCAATTIRFGQKVTITGTNTGTGSITGYVSGNVYYVITTNGSTTFTLSATWNGTAIASTAGTPVGLTFNLDGTTAGVTS